MRKYLKYSLGILVLSLYSMNWTTDSELDNWDTIHAQSNGMLDFSFKMKKQPTLADHSWINIEIKNETGEALKIVNAMYKVELQGINHKGKVTSEGFFKSSNPSEIFDLPFSPTPFEEAILPKGTISESERLSTLCASILGPVKTPETVHGTFQFYLELEGKHRFVVAPEHIEFRFDWMPLSDEDRLQINTEINYSLRNPSSENYEVHRISDLLSIPGIQKDLDPLSLLTGLGLRRDLREGRTIIAQFLAEHFSNHSDVKEYYKEHLAKQDYRILTDFKNHPELWSSEQLPQMISWLQSANNSTKFRILEAINERHSDWQKDNSTVNKLSEVVEDNFENLLKSKPELLDQRALVSWAAAAHMWSMTGNEKAIPYLLPFLENRTSILGSQLLLDRNSHNLPRANRVCDVALEAILRVQGKDLEKTYKSAGYRPPYLYGEAPIVVEKIRNDLIRDFGI